MLENLAYNNCSGIVQKGRKNVQFASKHAQPLTVSNLSQKLQTHKDDPEELTLEDRSCEGKISGLSLALGSREKELVNLSYELKKEASLKYEALEQNNTINSLLNLKKQELNKSELELDKLQERNNALSKELAALKFEVLKAHKASKKTKDSPSVLNGVDLHLTHTIMEPDVQLRKTKSLRVTENIMESTNRDGTCSYILIDDDAHTPKDSISPESPSYDSVPQPTKRATTNDAVTFVHEIGQDKHLSNITNHAPLPARSPQKAEFCFNPGLLGPDGTKSYLGKWVPKD
ncbi:hypothetical protein M8C21_016978 [Ambrosia artemisiifolia]|uniref:Uncharacterized protein n=1 Tax=Ambrosia artemisiifolia TaxID=4212 RepID=A0AAD5D1S8_AMBAR|nr:hypothetical protein M8C21_016978 [Ambrosia artemisiifolia]